MLFLQKRFPETDLLSGDPCQAESKVGSEHHQGTWVAESNSHLSDFQCSGYFCFTWGSGLGLGRNHHIGAATFHDARAAGG